MSKKQGHTGFRNEKLFCFNCGGSQVIPYPIDTGMFGAMAKEFQKQHKNCSPGWKPPEPDMSLTQQQRMLWWAENGEHGTSSVTIFRTLRPENLSDFEQFSRYQQSNAHPHDPDDFRRCYLLLKAIPEWRERIGEMAKVSKVWGSLAESWNFLETLLEEQLAGGKNDMYKLMQNIGC